MIYTSSTAAKLLLILMIGATGLMMWLLKKYGPEEGTHAQQSAAFKTSPAKIPELDKPRYYLALEMDMIFLLLYPATLSLACRMAANANADSPFWLTTGRFLSVLILSAVIVDILDNLTLWLFLNDRAGRGLLMFGGICALWDIGLFIICGVFSLAAFGWSFVPRH